MIHRGILFRLSVCVYILVKFLGKLESQAQSFPSVPCDLRVIEARARLPIMS